MTQKKPAMSTSLTVEDELGNPLTLTPEYFTIAGYTGRDRASVQHHIDELEAIGIAPPPHVPMYYKMPLDILTVGESIDVTSKESSGEVEPVLIVQDGTLYLGIGSDHTARDMERIGVAESKAACPKPIGRRVVRLEDETLRSGRLDAVVIESMQDGARYQHGSFKNIMPLADIYDAATSGDNTGKNGIIFCGTVPIIDGKFVFGYHFAAMIRGPGVVEDLALAYDTDAV